MQSSTDPCPSYPVSSYKFHITEWYTNRLVSNTTRTSELDTFILDGSNGLTRDQVYSLIVEAVNSIGSTFSEQLLFCKYRIYNKIELCSLNVYLNCMQKGYDSHSVCICYHTSTTCHIPYYNTMSKN